MSTTTPITQIIPSLTGKKNIPSSTSIHTASVQVAEFALFSVSAKAKTDITISIYQQHKRSGGSPASEDLVYQQSVSANSTFYKRFTIKGNFIVRIHSCFNTILVQSIYTRKFFIKVTTI